MTYERVKSAIQFFFLRDSMAEWNAGSLLMLNTMVNYLMVTFHQFFCNNYNAMCERQTVSSVHGH